MKYELTSESTTAPDGTKLFRIKALVSFGVVVAGAIGGFVANMNCLSQDGDAWVYGDARVYGNAQVSGNAWVSGNARVCDDAWVYGKTTTASRSDGYTFLVTPDKDGRVVIIAGCRYFTIGDARAHWTKTRGGTPLGDESLAIVDHLERMARIRGWLK